MKKKIINNFRIKANTSNVKKNNKNNKDNNIISKSNKISTMEKGNRGYSINPLEGKYCGSKEDSIKIKNKNKMLTDDIKTMREIKKLENYKKELSIIKKNNQKTIIDKKTIKTKILSA